MTKRSDLKSGLERGRSLGLCEARKFWPHRCEGGLDLHECLYLRNDVPPRKQDYLWDKHNCVLICHRVHMEAGQREDFNAAAVGYLIGKYSRANMQDYTLLAPFKVITPLEKFLLD